MKEVYLATTNRWKVRIAKEVIENQYGIVVNPVKLNLHEIQHEDPIVIANTSAIDAYNLVKRPVIKCDSGIRIPALNGFPGPFSSYIEKTIGIDGLLKICENLADRSAFIFSVVSFCDERLEPYPFYGEKRGMLLTQKRGSNGYFFDFIFIPDGYDQTLAEFDDNRRWEFWKDAYESFAKWYSSQ